MKVQSLKSTCPTLDFGRSLSIVPYPGRGNGACIVPYDIDQTSHRFSSNDPHFNNNSTTLGTTTTHRRMAYIASLSSLASTTLAPSHTTALTTFFASVNASAHPVQVADLARYDNMNTKDFSHFAYSLNYTQTGCFSQGALPVALASEDICLPGWYCTYTLSSQVSLPAFASGGAYRHP